MTACVIHSGLEHCNFLNTDISQGSVLAQLRCDRIVNEDFVANLLMNALCGNFNLPAIHVLISALYMCACGLLVHGQVTVIFVVSVCLFVCLFLCRVFLSRL